MIDKYYQKILYAFWASGARREDMRLFDNQLFDDPKIIKALKGGADIDGLAAQKIITNIEACDLLNTYAENSDNVYQLARRSAAAEEAKLILKYALDLRDTPESANYLEQYRLMQQIAEGSENTEKAKGYAAIFEKELSERASEAAAKYGLIELDNITGGIHRGQLIVIGARPRIGKSAIALQIAESVSAEHKVLFFPLEMTVYECFARLLARNGKVENKDLITGNLNETERKAAAEYLNELEKSSRLLFYEAENKLEAILQHIRRERPYLVIIDQLTQISTATKYKDTRERYKAVTATLKNAALKENTAIILLSQLNRESIISGATLESLHESDSTGQDADTVLLLEDVNKEESGSLKNIDLRIEKQRQGASGDKIRLTFYGEKYLFEQGFSGYRRIEDVKRY